MAALGYTDPDAKALASIGQSVNMALPTAVGLCTSSLALVLARERDFFTRPTGGGTIIRRLGLMVLLLPAIGGAFLVAGIRNDVFSAASGIWLLTVAAVLFALPAPCSGWPAWSTARRSTRAPRWRCRPRPRPT